MKFLEAAWPLKSSLSIRANINNNINKLQAGDLVEFMRGLLKFSCETPKKFNSFLFESKRFINHLVIIS